MPDHISNIILIAVIAVVFGLAAVGVAVKIGKNRFAPVKTVPAVVLDKHKVETFSKYSGNGKGEKYVVVFSVAGKKKSFYVSQFSYNGYKVNEKGTLQYKGDRLIGFQ